MKRVKGKYLEFIRRIAPDGLSMIEDTPSSFFDEEWFEIHSLSISNSTHIAHGMSSWIVKYKATPDYLSDQLSDFIKLRKLDKDQIRELKDFGKLLLQNINTETEK
jgi:hypothetical protein